MKYKMTLDVSDYSRLYNGKYLEEVSTMYATGLYNATYKHRVTGVIIRIQETYEELDYLIAESDSSESMDNFKDHLLLLSVN